PRLGASRRHIGRFDGAAEHQKVKCCLRHAAPVNIAIELEDVGLPAYLFDKENPMSAEKPVERSRHSTRREFIQVTGAAALLAHHAPTILTAQKTDPKYPIVGEGEFQYECHHNWG